MTSSIHTDGSVISLVVEALVDGRSEWTVQYGGHNQRSGISLTSNAAIAAAEAAAKEMERP